MTGDTKSNTSTWVQRTINELTGNQCAIDEKTLSIAQNILDEVGNGGEAAVRRISESLGDIQPGKALALTRSDLNKAIDSIDAPTRSLLERTADRIKTFADAQRQSLQDCRIAIPGGFAGHRWIPLESAGCYAPGGRYPLPSSVLMTAITARVAGVKNVWVASPNPSPATLAAASIAGADGLLCIGGAQAIGSFAHGIKNLISPVDVIVGPGNRFVTAAKSIVSRSTRIDMLAGPSEIVVVASEDANAKIVAADLLAQAEHDTDARPILITDSPAFAVSVQSELMGQLESLPTADVAAAALKNGGFVVATSAEHAIEYCEQIAPEHLSLQGEKYASVADRFACGSALFVGSGTAEVFGDYGAGPNHVLPTGGSARSQSGLSVATFMRMQTCLEIQNSSAAEQIMTDAAKLARVEGLEAHARSAELRIPY